jgi:Autophagy-related protein 27
MSVCVIKYNQRDKDKTISQIIPVAGTFPPLSLDAKTSIITSTGSDDVEGVRIELSGKVYLDQQQSTIIELSCDHSIDVPSPESY